jgi:hypothetical protein
LNYPEDPELHFTKEEYKEEVIDNKYAVPSPELAKFLKGKIIEKRVPTKLYYLKGGVNEQRDEFNAIVEDTEARTTAHLEIIKPRDENEMENDEVKDPETPLGIKKEEQKVNIIKEEK